MVFCMVSKLSKVWGWAVKELTFCINSKATIICIIFFLSPSNYSFKLLLTLYFLPCYNYYYNDYISFSYCLSKVFLSISSLIIALFLIFLALLANFNVLKDSPYESTEGDIAAIIVVLQLPPKLSSNNLVSLESL